MNVSLEKLLEFAESKAYVSISLPWRAPDLDVASLPLARVTN
jgi:hypothetical protein